MLQSQPAPGQAKNHGVIFDEKDAALLAEKTAIWEKRIGPRVGDFIRMKNGTLSRFTHDWDDEIQTGGECGSYYFFGSGASYSGGLDPSIKKTTFSNTGEMKLGEFWFFHHNESRAFNGVYVLVPCRIYQQN